MGDGVDPLDRSPLDIDWPRTLLVALVVATLLAVVVAASTSGAAFGAYNPSWDGADGLTGTAESVGAEADIVLNTSEYRWVNGGRTVSLVLSPDRAYTPAETERVSAFVRGGGTLIVTEDFGQHSNQLLRAVGAEARFDGSLVRDERHNYQSPAMPVARNVSEHPLLTGVERLTLNHGTVIEPNGARVVVRTSEFAYLDRNRNSALDEPERLDAYPVMTVEQVRAGRVIAVSDPSLFINAMTDRPGNDQFILNAFGAHERVLLDYSHAEQLPPLALALTLVRGSAVLQVLVVGVAVLVAGAWGRYGLVDRLRRSDPDGVAEGGGPSADELTAYLARQHPDWDETKARRVVEGTLTGRGEYGEDE